MKKFLTLILLTLSLLFTSIAQAAEEGAGSGVVDDSIRDISVVFGTGLVGAIIGLSTLSFVNKPSEHTKNIAVGGAIGIVIGVAAVVVNQASKTSSGITQNEIPMNADKFASLSKEDFREQKIAKDFHQEPTIAFSLNF